MRGIHGFTLLMSALMLVGAGCLPTNRVPATPKPPTPRPVYPPPDPDCDITSIQKLATTYENYSTLPGSTLKVISKQDPKGIYQVYTMEGDHAPVCISCAPVPGGPRVDRHKMMVGLHPSGRWIFVGVEEDSHHLRWLPQSWQIELMQTGKWLNMWITTPRGDRWYQMTKFSSAPGSAQGYVGPPCSSDGKTAVWTELVDGNVLINRFGLWKLYAADFVVRDGVPSFINKRDMSPPGAHWLEVGNFAPDNRHILLSTDLGLPEPLNPEGQDQWSLDIYSGRLQRLTNTPTVWDEHGVYSPNGRKITFMSSYPYHLSDPNSYHTWTLRTEIMLMNADGSGLQQLTHFNEPGHPESQVGNTVAAGGMFQDDGSLFVSVMSPNFGKTNWQIWFKRGCGMK